MSILDSSLGFLTAILPDGVSDLVALVVVTFAGFLVFSVISVVVNMLRELKGLILF